MRRALIVLAVAAIWSGCEPREEPPVGTPTVPSTASLSGEGTIRRGVGPECGDTWSVETADGDRLWPVTDPALQIEGLRVRFEAQKNERAMSVCMAGTNATFTRIARIDDSAAGGIWNTAWRLTHLGGDEVLDGAEATLEFPEQGRAVGRGSCNRFFALVAVTEESIRFSGIGSTRMACEEPVATQEQKYLKALESAERFAIEGDGLVIHSSALPEPLRFQRARS